MFESHFLSLTLLYDPGGHSFLICLMDISILACLGVVNRNVCQETAGSLPPGFGIEIQSLLEGTWAVWLGMWSWGESGSGPEERMEGAEEGLLRLFFLLWFRASWGGFLVAGRYWYPVSCTSHVIH